MSQSSTIISSISSEHNLPPRARRGRGRTTGVGDKENEVVFDAGGGGDQGGSGRGRGRGGGRGRGRGGRRENPVSTDMPALTNASNSPNFTVQNTEPEIMSPEKQLEERVEQLQRVYLKLRQDN